MYTRIDFLSSIVLLLFFIIRGYLLTLIYLRPSISKSLVVDCTYNCSGRGGQLIICAYPFWCIATNCNQHTPGNRLRLVEKMIMRIRNGIFFQTLYILLASKTLFVSLSACVQSMVIRVLRNVTTVRKHSIAAVTPNSFTTRTVAWFATSAPNALCNIMVDISDRSLSLPNIGTVLRVSARSPYPSGTFVWCRHQCMRGLVKHWLQSFPLHQSKCLLVGTQISRPKD